MVSKKKPIVFAGSVIGIEEEFSPGKNAFATDEGNVVSQVVGVTQQDQSSRTLGVRTRRQVLSMVTGTEILGRVVLVKDDAAVIEVVSAQKNGCDVAIPNATFAVPVSKCEAGFVKTMKEKFKLGDVVKARVDSVLPWGIDLTTQSPELGVIKAFCIRDRQPLVLAERGLKCMHCGESEHRKVSVAYVWQ